MLGFDKLVTGHTRPRLRGLRPLGVLCLPDRRMHRRQNCATSPFCCLVYVIILNLYFQAPVVATPSRPAPHPSTPKVCEAPDVAGGQPDIDSQTALQELAELLSNATAAVDKLASGIRQHTATLQLLQRQQAQKVQSPVYEANEGVKTPLLCRRLRSTSEPLRTRASGCCRDQDLLCKTALNLATCTQSRPTMC